MIKAWIVVAALLALDLAAATGAKYGHSTKNEQVLLPDDVFTPGLIRSTDDSEICDPKFRTKPFRKTTQSTKNKVYAEYGVEPNKGICKGGCEVDHRVPLELGGMDDIRNLWPQPSQPVPGFHQKDILENWLKRQVCKEHTMTLKQAQEALMRDWYQGYLKAHLDSKKIR